MLPQQEGSRALELGRFTGIGRAQVDAIGRYELTTLLAAAEPGLDPTARTALERVTPVGGPVGLSDRLIGTILATAKETHR